MELVRQWALLFCLFSFSNLPKYIVSSCHKGKERGEAEYQDPQELLAHSNNAAHPGGQGLHRDLEGGDGLEDLSVQDNLHTGLVTGRLETNVLHLVPAVTVTFSLRHDKHISVETFYKGAKLYFLFFVKIILEKLKIFRTGPGLCTVFSLVEQTASVIWVDAVTNFQPISALAGKH